MFLRLSMALVVGLIFDGQTPAADQPQRADKSEEIIESLFTKEVQIEGNINDMSLLEALIQLDKTYGITFRINKECFLQAMTPDIGEKKPNVMISSLRRLTLHQFLVQVLDSVSATYVIKGNAVEIVTVAHAAKMAKTTIDEDADGNKSLKEPLVCAIIKRRPLTETIELLASRYDLSITINPIAIEMASVATSAHIMNLPADKAIETLALQCDLRVVRNGNAYVITRPEHAKTLLAEQAEQERNKIELEKLRASTPRPIVPVQQKSETKSPSGTPTTPGLPNR